MVNRTASLLSVLWVVAEVAGKSIADMESSVEEYAFLDMLQGYHKSRYLAGRPI